MCVIFYLGQVDIRICRLYFVCHVFLPGAGSRYQDMPNFFTLCRYWDVCHVFYPRQVDVRICQSHVFLPQVGIEQVPLFKHTLYAGIGMYVMFFTQGRQILGFVNPMNFYPRQVLSRYLSSNIQNAAIRTYLPFIHLEYPPAEQQTIWQYTILLINWQKTNQPIQKSCSLIKLDLKLYSLKTGCRNFLC